MKSAVNQQSREHSWISSRKDHAEQACRLPADAQGSGAFPSVHQIHSDSCY